MALYTELPVYRDTYQLILAGIEPLIGYTKHGDQLGRSGMKSDETTKSADYAAVFGFNLRQLTRCLAGEVRPKVDVVNNSAANNANFVEKNEHAIGVIEMDGFTLILARR